ncbi:2-oxoacid:acceptor oxidoreductase family protein [Caldicoprobacter algeriensis]|uniref:2-oxoacid:acceptor oxidoreductase family protein n=1 Tax=Caldicoprobacter algeriensis TaxID=699281 RepID=UPI002079F051|nr:2-oxoacid:acceptor oxidoreductase family protein [Caldicoprobacter algeriensis]MCM8900219.1 2-oxoacid:acceptor oxidoreductase family protein [Caldicoprobacter algeriensis]
MTHQIIIAGFGGQGIMLMGQLLAYAGMLEGKNVSWLPSYGPEMRGGTANCNVIISDEPVASPIVTEATAVMVMNRPSLDRFEGAVMRGGLLLVNSSLIDKKASRDDIEVCYIPANEIADQLGNSRVANMVMLGSYIAKTGAVSPAFVIESLRKALGPSKEHFITLNEEALKRGAECVKECVRR